VISGWHLVLILLVLLLWLVSLALVLIRTMENARLNAGMRGYLTSGGIICAWIAVGALFVLHLTWISPDISQRFGVVGVKIIGQLIFWLTLTSLLLSLVGSGKSRWAGLVSCIGIGLWDFALIMSAAISMAAPIARHPTRFLIPAGYVGWVTVKYGEDSPPLPMSNGEYICRIPDSGLLATSSMLEEGWAKDEYFYYSRTGMLESIPETGWGRGGKVWGGTVGKASNEDSDSRRIERIYIGTEDQFSRGEVHQLN
jgi:hypothetical protein